MSNLIPESELPPTRLELRWVRQEPDADGYTARCDYHLVLELMEYDIRGEVYDDDYNLIERKREKRIELGGCRTTGDNFIYDDEQGGKEIRTPYRDGCHIRQDAMRLGVPAFVVTDGLAMRIQPAEE